MECSEYNLCDSCHDSGAHPAEHHMLKIEVPADSEYIDDVVSDGVCNGEVTDPPCYRKRRGIMTCCWDYEFILKRTLQ